MIRSDPVMLNYAGEYSNYCDACQSSVTVIMSSDVAVKSWIERLTISCIIQTKEIFMKWLVLKASKQSLVVLLRCDIFQGRSVSVGVSMKKSVVGSVTVFIIVH